MSAIQIYINIVADAIVEARNGQGPSTSIGLRRPRRARFGYCCSGHPRHPSSGHPRYPSSGHPRYPSSGRPSCPSHPGRLSHPGRPS